jgi:hypothetical protein
MSLTEVQCSAILSPALNAVLPKLHMNQHKARSIIYGPEKYGGLYLPNVYTLQCVGQLSLFVGHLHSQDKTATLILISMNTLQLLVGSLSPFLQLPYPNYAKWIERYGSVSLG